MCHCISRTFLIPLNSASLKSGFLVLSALGMENPWVVMDTVFIGAFILAVDVAHS